MTLSNPSLTRNWHKRLGTCRYCGDSIFYEGRGKMPTICRKCRPFHHNLKDKEYRRNHKSAKTSTA